MEFETPLGAVFKQRIAYDWRPKFCTYCVNIGHDLSNCWYNGSNEEGNDMNCRNKKSMRRRKKKANAIWQEKPQDAGEPNNVNDELNEVPVQ